ncbi:MAG: Gfo/Idh/MocA family oxidoreductase, partial [Bacteroidota bacterium]
MKKRTFLKTAAIVTGGAMILPACNTATENTTSEEETKPTTLRTAHIGVGNMGLEDLKAVASHPAVVVTALCDVDSNYLEAAHQLFPEAKTYKDYRVMLKEMGEGIDAVVVSTPDHT